MLDGSSTIHALPTTAALTGPREPYGTELRLKALGLMTAGIVHDVGNIIQVLSSAVTIFDRHPGFERRRHFSLS